MRKNNLIIYNNFIDPIKSLSDKDAGRLFKKIISYHFDETTTEDNDFVEFAFKMIKPLIDQNNIKYENICKRNAENGSKGGRPIGTKKTQSVILGTQKNPKKLNRIEENIIKEKINKKEKYIFSVEEELQQPLREWLHYRKDLKEPMQWTYQYNKLKKFDNPEQVVEFSIGQGYKGLFEEKQNFQSKKSKGINLDW